MKDFGQLEQQAIEVLSENDRGTHTVPSGGMYPHAWLWDSALTAIGIRHLDPERAGVEVSNLFEGQWQNGMVPNMQFTVGRPFSDPPFRPDYLLWSSRLLNKNAPRSVPTSGITQPPIIAEAAWRVGQKLDTDERQAFWKDSVAKLINYHQWIYAERDPNKEGLLTAIHPWETGMENTPAWIEHMRTVFDGREAGMRQKLVKLHDYSQTGQTSLHRLAANLQSSLRRDSKETDPEERATFEEGILYMEALARIVRSRYYHRYLADHHPLHVQDVHMNSVLIRNNEILQQLAAETGQQLPEPLQENMAKTRGNIEQLWDEESGMYFPRDAVSGTSIKISTIASLMPLYGGSLPKERAARLMQHAEDPQSFGLAYGLPTVPANSPYFQERRYWSGASWVNMNWLIKDGQQRLGYINSSEELAHSTLEMAKIGGLHEYFSAHKATGLGANKFSWSAALVIDMLRTESGQ